MLFLYSKNVTTVLSVGNSLGHIASSMPMFFNLWGEGITGISKSWLFPND